MVGSGDLQVETSFYIQRRKWFLFKTKYNGTNDVFIKNVKNLMSHYMQFDLIQIVALVKNMC